MIFEEGRGGVREWRSDEKDVLVGGSSRRERIV